MPCILILLKEGTKIPYQGLLAILASYNVLLATVLSIMYSSNYVWSQLAIILLKTTAYQIYSKISAYSYNVEIH